MNSWLSVPAGPPIEPGKQEVKYTGITMVFSPTAKPSSSLDSTWLEIDKLNAPISDPIIVK
jgi:hypothetical protein